LYNRGDECHFFAFTASVPSPSLKVHDGADQPLSGLWRRRPILEVNTGIARTTNTQCVMRENHGSAEADERFHNGAIIQLDMILKDCREPPCARSTRLNAGAVQTPDSIRIPISHTT
jgi:hypothetical protein